MLYGLGSRCSQFIVVVIRAQTVGVACCCRRLDEFLSFQAARHVGKILLATQQHVFKTGFVEFVKRISQQNIGLLARYVLCWRSSRHGSHGTR